MIGQSGRSLDVESVTVGMTVYDFAADCDPDTYLNGRGGTVIAIETDVDSDTGEVQRRFIVCEPYRGAVRFHAITADEALQAGPLDVSLVRATIRHLAKVVADSKRTMTTDEARAITAEYALMEALS